MNQLLDYPEIQLAFPGEYNQIIKIGQGQYGKVYKAETKHNELVAIKVIDIKNMQKEIIPYMENEIKLLSESENRNVIKLFKSHRSEKTLVLILEYCSMDVEHMSKRYFKGKLPDQLVIIILRQIANGLSYLHKRHIIHRDLKLENFGVQLSNEDQELLLTKADTSVFERATYKLLDLGLAKQLSDLQGFTNTWAGAELNMAPEILNEQKYSFEADMYSLGICLYYMLVGKYPYYDPTNRTPLQDLIQRENADFSGIHNQLLKELVKQMLRYNPKERLTFQDLYNHDYIKLKQGDLQAPLDLELNENQEIYSQKFEQFYEVIKSNGNSIDQEQIPFTQPQQQKNELFDSFRVNSQEQQQQFLQMNTTKIYNPNQHENDQILQLYNLRNQYITILKLAEYLEQLVGLVKNTKLTFMTMKSKFGMYIEYLKMVSKQLMLKLKQQFDIYELTLNKFDSFRRLVENVTKNDYGPLQNIYIREGSSQSFVAAIKKSVFKIINCEPQDSENFDSQYENINKEIYQELLKMLQDSFYKFQNQESLDQIIKQIKCLLYLSMINTARARILFKIRITNVDYKQEELLIASAKEEPDILSEKIITEQQEKKEFQ